MGLKTVGKVIRFTVSTTFGLIERVIHLAYRPEREVDDLVDDRNLEREQPRRAGWVEERSRPEARVATLAGARERSQWREADGSSSATTDPGHQGGRTPGSRGSKPPTGFPEPAGLDPGDISTDPTPHHVLNTPVGEADPTEWPDPYEAREDPRDPPNPDGRPFGVEPHPATGSQSTSAPHPSQDPEAEPWEGPKRDKLDD
jgi:hypothetical protein